MQIDLKSFTIRQFRDNKNKFAKWTLFVIGFLTISFVIGLEPSAEPKPLPHKKWFKKFTIIIKII